MLSLEEEMASLREERDKLKATLSGTGLKVSLKNIGSRWLCKGGYIYPSRLWWVVA